MLGAVSGIQKYERGTKCVGASRLQNIADILNVHVSFFFEDALGNDAAVIDARKASPSDDFQTFLSSSEGFRLNREFVKITDPNVRHSIIEMVKAAAATRDDN